MHSLPEAGGNSPINGDHRNVQSGACRKSLDSLEEIGKEKPSIHSIHSAEIPIGGIGGEFL